MNRHTLVGSILASALRLWLKSQVEWIEDLQVEVVGNDFQLLKGNIPSVSIACCRAGYQGLHLRQIWLEGKNIRLSLGQIINAPLRLLEPVPVMVQAVLEESDLQASLSSPLLSVALTDLFLTLLDTDPTLLPTTLANSISTQSLKPAHIHWQGATLTSEELLFTGTLIHRQDSVTFTLRAGVAIANPHALCLQPLDLEIIPENRFFTLNAFLLDLGADVELEAVSLASGKLTGSGKLVIFPHSN